MTIRVENLGDYYNQHIEPRRNATTLQKKFKVFFDFNNDGIFKIFIVVGAILAIIGTIGCMVNGLHYMGWANSFERIHSIGIGSFMIGLVFAYVHQKVLLHTIHPYIATTLGK